jgi:outer membrane lipoprotein-sorting protein
MEVLMSIFIFTQFSIDSIIEKCKIKWDAIETYTCTYESYQKKGKEEDKRTYFVEFKKPLWIRLKVLKGKDRGSEVMYNPEKDIVRGRKGGLLRGIVLTLKPDDKKVVSLRGYRVYHAGIGEIYRRIFEYYEKGYPVKLIGKFKEEGFEGWKIEFEVKEPGEFFGCAREVFWIRNDFIPYKCEQWNENGEYVLYSRFFKVDINVSIKEERFKL